MFRLEVEMWGSEGGGVVMSFTDGKGRGRNTWFLNPPDSIDHVSLCYLQNRLPNVKNERHIAFIKRRFKEEIVKHKGPMGIE